MLRTGERVVLLMWRCDVMLRTGQRVMLVHVELRCYVTYWTADGGSDVEVRCYVTYWTAGGGSACGGAMLCYALDSGWW